MASIAVEKRSLIGKNACKKLRAKGRIPGIVYGLKKEVLPIELSLEEFLPWLKKREKIFQFQLDNRQEDVMLKELHHDTFSDIIYHVDFCRIDMNVKITVNIPINFIGIPKGVKSGGSMQKMLQDLHISCLPVAIPESIPLNVEKLDIGEHVRVKELVLASGLEVTNDPEDIVVTVVAAKVEAAAAGEGEEKVEPQVIKKAKADEETAS